MSTDEQADVVAWRPGRWEVVTDHIGTYLARKAGGRYVTYDEAATTITALQERIKELEGEAQFLIERLDDFERGSLCDDIEDACRDFDGHVSPAIERLRSTLKDSGNGSEVAR